MLNVTNGLRNKLRIIVATKVLIRFGSWIVVTRRIQTSISKEIEDMRTSNQSEIQGEQ